ncbi:hypothetical protein [Planctomicrobium piriforme]|uniref:Uncharacterized protein n=1 Tax=Planctomicrobium piriforme TaxID=1576369 RepID=A0A1I3HMB7_9PLAN|nr:hypothetical protein [Planctomicrobium piriforme]SFI36864.1 hypothetical protein SAMN05421753_108121 [Planctomicrobium piriforme]
MSRNHESSPILAGNQVRVAAHPFVLSEKQSGSQPLVTLRREGDVIREIHVRCACGETIILDCDYAAGTVSSTHRHAPQKAAQ